MLNLHAYIAEEIIDVPLLPLKRVRNRLSCGRKEAKIGEEPKNFTAGLMD